MLAELRILLLAMAIALPAGALTWFAAGEVVSLIAQHGGDPAIGPFAWLRVLLGIPL